MKKLLATVALVAMTTTAHAGITIEGLFGYRVDTKDEIQIPYGKECHEILTSKGYEVFMHENMEAFIWNFGDNLINYKQPKSNKHLPLYIKGDNFVWCPAYSSIMKIYDTDKIIKHTIKSYNKLQKSREKAKQKEQDALNRL